MFRSRNDINPLVKNNNTNSIQSNLLTDIKTVKNNDYSDSGSFAFMASFAPNAITHTSSFDGYLGQDANTPNSILIFGKYQTSSSGNDFFDVDFSNETGATGASGIPSTLISGLSIRGSLKADGYLHFSHPIQYPPKYITIRNSTTDYLLNFELYYVRLNY